MARKTLLVIAAAALTGFAAVSLYFSGLFQSAEPACAQESSCLEDACTGDCVAYQYFLSKSLEPWIRWYDTAVNLTGCDDPAWQQYAQWMLDIASELVGAPGGYVLNCHQMIVGQAYVCGNQCSSNPCRYAPNVSLTLSACGEGTVSAEVDNNNLGGLPEYETSAYSRQFNLRLSISRDSGQKVVVGSQAVPSLSYSNWIINGGYTQCAGEYGTGRPCNLIEPFLKPSSASFDFEWGDGLYNLDGMTSNSSGMDSLASSGAIALKSEGDKVTINQGDLRGVVYVWDHDLENDTVSESLTAWDASGGSMSFTNHECNCWFCWCNAVGTRRDVDTYIVATGGDPARRLLGEYTLVVDAILAHDKDLSDNTAGCSFTALHQPPPSDAATATPEPVTIFPLTPGLHHISPDSVHPNRLYSLQVPAGLAYFNITQSSPEGTAGNYDIYLRRGSPPSPYMSDYCPECGDCVSDNDGGYDDMCGMNNPAAGAYYLLVMRDWGSGPYDLNVQFIGRTPSATKPPSTATFSATLPPTNLSNTPTPVVDNLTDGGITQDEQESNDTRPTATLWDGLGPMSGMISTNGDKDQFRWTAPASGIFTFNLTNMPGEIQPDLVIYNESGYLILSDFSQPFGSPVSLSLDANSGDIFYVLVKATLQRQVSTQPYRIEIMAVSDPHEPDDTFNHARAWADLSVAQQGFFWEKVSGDGDYYTFTVPQSALLTVELSGVAGEVSPDLFIYNSNRSILASDYAVAAGGSIKLTVDADAEELIYVKVRPSERRQTSAQSYTLSADLVPDPHEPDNIRSQAVAWDFAAGPAQGYFWERASGDGDYYRITTPASDSPLTLTVLLENVTSPVEADLSVYNARGTLLDGEYGAPAGQSVQLSFEAQGGSVYYIRVRPTLRGQVSGSPYTLRIQQ